ncbi:helicase associated domain-containing protein [Pelagophyceae sp. CCMP2097]|nr:helicase associated domain-containing protein [Pelagophyceae sp. CCMP2097]
MRCLVGGRRLASRAAAAAPLRPGARLASSSRRDWGALYLRLEAYREAEGHCAVPYSFMSPERVERLEAVAFVWDPLAKLAHLWDTHFEALQAYRAAHCDCTVPARFVAADGTKLGQWVFRQRKAYKAGNMRTEHIDRLESAGFVWTVRPGWDTHFELLTAYHAAHGNCVVPQNFAAADGTKLGAWVKTQRTAYTAGKMSPERVERLEAVAFVWDPLADGWDTHFEALQAYRAAHCDSTVPARFVAADDTKLGQWVFRQRKAYKAGNMRTEHIDRLEVAGFVWTVRPGWDAHFELVEIYHASHGDCNVPASFAAADSNKLGQWVARQRVTYKAGELSPEQVERLEAVNFVAVDGTKLGRWVFKQRHAHKAGKMSLERAERMEAAGFE